MTMDGIDRIDKSLITEMFKTMGIPELAAPGAARDVADKVPVSLTNVTISAFGKKINEMYSDLKQIEDPDQREAALKGMREVMLELSGSGDPSEMLGFIQSMDDLKESDAGAVQDFFTTANTISEENYGLGGWLDTFLALGSTDLQGDFLAETQSIIYDDSASDAEKHATFEQFMTGVNEILTDEDADTESVMSRYFSSLSQAEDLEAKQTVMDEFEIDEAHAEETESEESEGEE